VGGAAQACRAVQGGSFRMGVRLYAPSSRHEAWRARLRRASFDALFEGGEVFPVWRGRLYRVTKLCPLHAFPRMRSARGARL